MTSGALNAVVDIAEGLDVDVERMRDNLDVTGGQIMAEAVAFKLAEAIGKSDAHKLVEEASKRAHAENISLKDALAAEPKVTAVVPASELSKLFDPMSYQGVAQAFIDRLVATAKAGR